MITRIDLKSCKSYINMAKAWKIGMGAVGIILGIYIMFNQQNLAEVTFGAIAIGFGIWLLASD